MRTLINYIKWYNDEVVELLDAAGQGNHTKDTLQSYISSAKSSSEQLQHLLNEAIKELDDQEK